MLDPDCEPRPWALLMAGLLSVVGVLSLPDALILDDAWTHFRVARNVAAGAGPVFTAGDGVIGSTSVLYVYLLGGLAALTGWQVYVVAAIVTVAMAPVLGVLARCLCQPGPFASVAWLVPVLFLPLPFVRDCVGMEMPLYVAVALAAVALADAGRNGWLGIMLTALCLLRPDGALLAALVVTWVTVRDRRVPVLALAVAAVMALPWIVFALLRFGTVLPLSASAKFAHARSGLWVSFGQDLGSAVVANFPWAVLVLAVVGIVVVFMQRRMPMIVLVAWVTTYDIAASIAGVTAYRWYYQPTFIVIALLAVEGLGWILTVIVRGRFRTPGAGRLVTILALVVVSVTAFVSNGRASPWPQDLVPHHDRYVPLAKWVARIAPPSARLGTLEIGHLGYHSGLGIVDFCGLVTPGVAERIPSGTQIRWCLDELRPEFVLAHHPASALEPGLLDALPQDYVRIRTLADCSIWRRNDVVVNLDPGATAGAVVEPVVFDAAAVGRFVTINVLRSMQTPDGVRHIAANAGAVLVQRLDLAGPISRVRIGLRVERLAGAEGAGAEPTTMHVAWTSTSQPQLHPTARAAVAVTPGPDWRDVVVDLPPAWFVPGERLLDLLLMPASEPTVFTVRRLVLDR